MSLINDMLRDLDRRGVRNQPNSETEAGAAVSERNLANASSGGRSLSSWLPALAAFVLVATLVLWEQNNVDDQQSSLSKSEQSGQDTAAESTESLSGVGEVKEVVLVPNFYPELLAAMEPPGEEESPDQSPVIEQLMRDADRALDRDRLTSPIEDNAYARYQQVLALAPEHAGARRGLARITRRYLDLAENYIERGNALRAEVLLRRAQTVQAQHPDIPAVVERLGTLSEQGGGADRNSTGSNRAPDSASLDIKVTERATPSVPDESKLASPLEGRLEVRPNAESLDRQAVQQAQQLIGQGRQHSARLKLEKLVEEYPTSPRSAVLLTKIYLDQGDLKSARELLGQSEYLPTDEQTQLRAELAVAEGRPEAAIDLLEQQLDSATENESYRALLAGLYYGAERHAEAASHYRRLLDKFGTKPAYWLGLALALDSQNLRPSALEAFRRARASGYYNAEGQGEVRDYVERRIASLERQGN